MSENTFMQECNEFYEKLGSHKKMVLSTSCKDKVTSRMMSIIVLNNMFYFQTDINSRKANQILSNSYVALCVDNIQIEGVCKNAGAIHT